MSNLPETDEQKVIRFTGYLKDGHMVKETLRSLLQVDAPFETFHKADTLKFVKRYESSEKRKIVKYAKRLLEQINEKGGKDAAASEASPKQPQHPRPITEKSPAQPPPAQLTNGLEMDESMFKPRKEWGKVYAGRSRIAKEEKVAPKESCESIVPPNIHCIRVGEHTTYETIEPSLAKLDSEKLLKFLKLNPQFINDSDELFIKFIEEKFPGEVNKKRYELTWKQWFEHLKDKQDNFNKYKLEDLTSRIGSKHEQSGVRRAILIDNAPIQSRKQNHQNHQQKLVNNAPVQSVSQTNRSFKPGNGHHHVRSQVPARSSKAMKKKVSPLMAKSLKMAGIKNNRSNRVY